MCYLGTPLTCSSCAVSQVQLPCRHGPQKSSQLGAHASLPLAFMPLAQLASIRSAMVPLGFPFRLWALSPCKRMPANVIVILLCKVKYQCLPCRQFIVSAFHLLASNCQGGVHAGQQTPAVTHRYRSHQNDKETTTSGQYDIVALHCVWSAHRVRKRRRTPHVACEEVSRVWVLH
jgi:hypothetical protein